MCIIGYGHRCRMTRPVSPLRPERPILQPLDATLRLPSLVLSLPSLTQSTEPPSTSQGHSYLYRTCESTLSPRRSTRASPMSPMSAISPTTQLHRHRPRSECPDLPHVLLPPYQAHRKSRSPARPGRSAVDLVFSAHAHPSRALPFRTSWAQVPTPECSCLEARVPARPPS
jgi:hypothetical protein